MLKRNLHLLILIICSFFAVNANANMEARKEAETLLDLMDYDYQMNLQLEKVLELQANLKPELAAIKEPMREFFQKYMNYEALKPMLIEIYLEAFTVDELHQINQFYRSPVGKKSLEKIPVLSEKGRQLAENQIRAHMYELDQMIKDYVKKNPEKLSKSTTLGMINKLHLKVILFDATFRYSKKSQYYNFMKAKIGEENTEKIIKEEILKILPEYQDTWNNALASAIETVMDTQHIHDLASNGKESIYYEKYISKTKEIFDLLSEQTDGLVEEISNKAMNTSYYHRSN